MNTAIVGLGFGDEGKGKIAHIESSNADIVVRYNGGANAGHTVCVEGDTYKLHHIPAGAVANNEPILVLSHGMVINPVSLLEEIKTINRSNIDIRSRLYISANAHCVMPWHIAADIKKGGKIGTTKKGIGPCYADKMHRWNAIRMGDLMRKLDDERTQRFFAIDETFHGNSLWHQYKEAAEELQPMIIDTGEFLRDKVKQRADILFEGANGILLDIDFGTYPYCTSSGVGPAAIPQSCGLPNLHLDRIIGVIKCYATRVGEGPFPSEICPVDETPGCRKQPLPYQNKLAHNELVSKCGSIFSVDCDCPWCISHRIRERGGEYGTTTGRPRRIGWLDIDMTRKAVELTGATEIALMHADTIGAVRSPKMLLCGEIVDIQYRLSPHVAGSVEWSRFAHDVSDLLSCPITYISTGPDENDMVRGPFTRGYHQRVHISGQDYLGHDWIDRGTNIAPYKCQKCGALSGTDQAVDFCRE